MITKITMKNVACYKQPAILETDKKVNLIYGLNGTGKSTLSDYLYDRSHEDFSHCLINGLNDDEDIFVYNQQFIKEYFYQPDNLKGIFTLSKENKQAEEAVRTAEKEIELLNASKDKLTTTKQQFNDSLRKKCEFAENKIWEIKTTYSGGDRVFEIFLTGLMGRKNTLYSYVSGLSKPANSPVITLDQLKKEVEAIEGSSAKKYDPLPIIQINIDDIESNQMFAKEIIGNENSSVSQLINELKNSDWVKLGLNYLPAQLSEKGIPCPFCQQNTITISLIDEIKNYFDVTYEKYINEIKTLQSEYFRLIKIVQSISSIRDNPFVQENKSEFNQLLSSLNQIYENNKRLIQDKINNPSQIVTLQKSSNLIVQINEYLSGINTDIDNHNKKIDNKEKELEELKNMFWEIMRWNYDQTISAYDQDKCELEKKINDINGSLKKIDGNIQKQGIIIKEQQKNTVNIDEAISNINNGLIELGIDGFAIEKHSDILYEIARKNHCEDTFETLSEGEKMIISFLYFRELCKGKRAATSRLKKKIIIIDDPISSLSHIYVFNVGQMIKNEFFNSSNCEQVFLLTHSLYFFYEMTDINHNRRNKNQKLFRLIKNSDGSQINGMKYEEIQNDYHSYWYVIKDDNQPAPLIANCMRNIIEYFFNFVEKNDFNNVFQKPVLQEVKYQAFCRYINRESHSLGQNIFDYKEFDYTVFKEALSHVFIENGYKEHYEAMIK